MKLSVNVKRHRARCARRYAGSGSSNMIRVYFRSSNASSLSTGGQLKIQKVKRLFQTFIVSVINKFILLS